MRTEEAGQSSPEEEELATKRAELTWLEVELATREQDLVTLKAELAAFEEIYLRELGSLNAQLDEWKVRLAKLPAEQFGAPNAFVNAAQSPPRAKELSSTANSAIGEDQEFSPSHELKSLYREAARTVHPDIAISENDRMRRERSMKEVNAAYAAGDEDTLHRIITEFQYSPDAVEGSGAGVDLIRVLRQLRQVRNRISVIELEISELSRSDMGQIKAKADIAAKGGRDLIAEMAVSIQNQLDELRRRHGHVAISSNR